MKYVAFVLASLITTNAFAEEVNTEEVKETSPVVTTEIVPVTKQEAIVAPKTYPIPDTETEVDSYRNNSGLFVQAGIGLGLVGFSGNKNNSQSKSAYVGSLMLGTDFNIIPNHVIGVVGVEETVHTLTSNPEGIDNSFSLSVRNSNLFLQVQTKDFFFRPFGGISEFSVTQFSVGNQSDMSQKVSIIGNDIGGSLGGMGNIGRHWHFGGQISYQHSFFKNTDETVDCVSLQLILSSF